MLTAVATVTDASVSVVFVSAEDGGEEEENQPAETDLNPIAPEPKEMLWGFGSFVVFAVLMRLYLYPRLRKGMDARGTRSSGRATSRPSRSPTLPVTTSHATRRSWRRSGPRRNSASKPPGRRSTPSAPSA